MKGRELRRQAVWALQVQRISSPGVGDGDGEGEGEASGDGDGEGEG